MARVSIYYDNDKKEQFFMVRGDERYARSTKTILELVSTDQELLYFNAVVQVNVLRDVGEGSIVLMDNDVVVPVLLNINNEWVESEVIPWDSQLNGLTFKLNNLTYDVDHNLTAKYIGNKSCSPSLSNNLLMNIEDTHKTTAILTIDDTIQIDRANSVITKTITLDNDLSDSYNRDQEIIVTYDNTQLTPVTTNTNGIATIQIPDCGDNGLHTITVDYGGSSNLYAKKITQDISVGYDIQITDTPSVIVCYQPFSFTARLLDWFGNPISNATLTELKFNINSTTDSQGYASFNATYLQGPPVLSIVQLYFEYAVTEHILIRKYANRIPAIYIHEMTISTSQSRLYKGESNLLRINTNSIYANTPIVLTGAVNETIYTGENGFVATKNLIGDGKGEKTITATAGNLTKTINLTDYIQYWSPNDIHPSPEQYNLLHGNLLKLNSYFRIDLDALYNEFRFKLPVPKNKPFKLYINGITTNASCLCYLAYGNDIRGENIQNIQYSNGTIEIGRDSQNNIIANIRNGNYESQTQVNYNGDEIGFAMSNINPNTKLQCIFNQLYYYEG